MKFLLLVTKPYSIGILEPIYQYLKKTRIGEACWFLGNDIQDQQLDGSILYTNESVRKYNPDVVIAPGNVVPDFWPGLKVQIFHGLGEEKRGHYRITGFFDLYCTPGLHMTKLFTKLKQKHKSFLVRETGWPKLDIISQYLSLDNGNKFYEFETNDPVILYAPTFSPRYSSAYELIPQIRSLLDKPINWLIKFHDLMDKDLVNTAKELECKNLIVADSDNIVPLMADSDILMADTSSVTYEYLLFNKPIITFNSTTRTDKGINIDTPEELFGAIVRSLEDPNEFSESRKAYLADLHPYTDGKSSERLIDIIIDVIQKKSIHGLKKKNPGWMRKRQAKKLFSQ